MVNQSTDDIDPHTQVARDLPWYVNGTLAKAAGARVRAHLEICESCRADYEAQLRLYGAMRVEDSLTFAAEPSFQKLMARIEGLEATADTRDLAPAAVAAVATARAAPPGIEGRRPRRQARTSKLVYWLAAAVVIEAIGLALGPSLLRSPAAPDAAYATLSSRPQSYGEGTRVRVVFKAGIRLAQLALLVRSIDAHIVDGPTDADVYTLGFAQSQLAPAELQARIGRLRASPEVVFAEPVDSGERGR